ncbi:AsmA family protein, partial [Arthrospira platensis SPKY1]|nr:AsmA family protein [Arthrospira platensis SPKY1]
MKKLLGFIILLGLFALLVLVAAHFFLGHAAKFALERTLPQFTKTPVAIESVSLSPFFGRAEVKGFALGNPEGFSSEHAIKLRALKIDFQPRTLWQPTFIINRIEVLGPEFTLEGRGSNQNLAVLLNTLQERTQSKRKPAPTDETPETSESRFIIRQLV